MAALHAAAMTVPRPWTEAEFAALLSTPGTFATGDATAFALGRAILDEAELLTIATHPGRRRRGLGRACLAAFEAEARARADPALIYDLGGKFDKSFNEAAYGGAERWKAETGGEYRDLEITSEAQREQALRRFAENGFNPIVTTGFAGPASSIGRA
jgi:GNAT superfamily N-acetyltransferase